MNSRKQQIVFGILLVLVGLAGRLLPHPENFSPLVGLSLMAAAFVSRSWLGGLLIPVGTLMISDLVLGFYSGASFVYLAIALSFALSRPLLQKFKWSRLGWSTLMASCLFFAFSNLGVFLFAGLYEKSVAGFIQCYSMALPFFRMSLLGDFVWTFTLFGSFELSRRYLFERQAKSSA